MNLLPYDPERLWTKARLFIHRAMDHDREFEEQAFWSAAAFELLGKAALARVSPILIANPNPDGHSLLVASGLLGPDDKFFTIPAQALWSRCKRAFKPFNEKEARHISAVRNDYLHAGSVGLEGTPDIWWPRFWSQAAILVSHLDRELEDLVGRSRVGIIEQHLLVNRANLQRRLEAMIDRAQTRYALHQSGSLSTALERAWEAFTPSILSYSTSADCPACEDSGTLSGDEIIDTRTDRTYTRWNDDEYEDQTVWHQIGSSVFSCEHCHFELWDLELIEAAGLDTGFEVEGDAGAYYEPEYNNE